MDSKTCVTCGAELSPELPGTKCPACLLEFGMAGIEPGEDSLPRKTGTGPAAGRASGMGRLGDYELLAEIARGGQGVVYRARHISLDREVALKMLPFGPWATEAHLERFRTEARVTAELDHPAIVPIYDIGEFEGQHYFTMKLIDGAGLNRLPPGQLLSPRRVAEIIAEAARGLHHAHERGVLHRDIKPGNIILDTAGHPHLTDFGLAKLMENESTLTQTLELLGTPSYISPEMARGAVNELSPATDVYGLGTVMYQLLTGNPPFAGGTTLETVRQVIETEPRRPRRWIPKLDRDLEVICLKCLEKQPARRYASAGALAEDIERWLRHEPIRARPGGVVYRSRKWFRRHAGAAALTAIIAIAIALLAANARRGGTLPPPHSLAVLLRSADGDSKYLTTEFSRDLIHALGKLRGASVAPRSAMLKWEQGAATPEEAGTALRVPRILAGRLQQSGDAFHFDLQLIDVASGTRLWRKSFEEKLSGGATAQTQIVRAVATALGIELTEENRAELRRPLSADTEAWMHYLRGRQHLDTLSEPKLLQAIAEFEQAIARDPDFAEAYAGLADAHLDLGYTFRNPALHFAKAKEYVREALKRDETLPGAIIASGVLSYFLDWDWQAAERAVKQAVLLDPSALENHACYLHSMETLGRTDDAHKTVQIAFTYHPSSIAIQSELGCSAYYAGKFADAGAYWRQSIKNDPDNAYLHWGMARTLAQQGLLQDAATVLESAQRKPAGDWTAILSELAYVRAREGRRSDAHDLIAQLRERAKGEYVDPYLFAMAYAGLGDTAAVFDSLEQALAVRSTWIPSLPVDPKFAGFRNDARYQQILATLKLPLRTASVQ